MWVRKQTKIEIEGGGVERQIARERESVRETKKEAFMYLCYLNNYDTQNIRLGG